MDPEVCAYNIREYLMELKDTYNKFTGTYRHQSFKKLPIHHSTFPIVYRSETKLATAVAVYLRRESYM